VLPSILVSEVVRFGGGARSGIEAVVKAAARGRVRALLIDARTPDDLVRAMHLLRALYDDPRRPLRVLHPTRVIALVSDGDVGAAFAFGRYGIAGVLEDRRTAELELALARAIADPAPPLELPILAPARTARLTGTPAGELPTVVIGYRHAPETLAGLARYRETLAAAAHESTVFADVATLIDVMVREGLSCQTNLATKAGTTHTGQFIGSFEFYRELRRTRYARISDPPDGLIAMDVFIAIDEVLHELLHLLFLANHTRAGLAPRHVRIAEEISLSWWQGVVHHRVFPEWIRDRHILEINDDFTLSEAKQESWAFWTAGNVFDPYAHYPWVPYVLAQLPERPSYIGERPDLSALVAALRHRPEAAFLVARAAELTVPVSFESYPAVPDSLRIA
jgi:hypothetical protein